MRARMQMGAESAVLKKQLRLLDARIEAVKQRLPAHSVPPALMQELLDLEDERARLEKEMKSGAD